MSSQQKSKSPEILRHSTAHVLAAAVLEMFPEAKFGIGPSIENGFYYDFQLPRTLIPEDLALLKEKMRKIINRNHPFEKSELGIQQALEHFKKVDQKYKLELISNLQKEGAESVTLYKSGHFVDLCSGPHLDSTGEIPADAFKLTKISGAYWKGDEKNSQLQRIYGVVFADKKELKNYLFQLEEAEKRDHRKIGKELDLFSFHPEAPGMPFFHPKGTVIYNELKNFWIDSQKEFEYETVLCPSMLDVSIWKKSGHWDHYKDDMYFVQADEKKQFGLRPMDCPGAILIYNNSMKSYRDLPLRYAEPGLITRREKSGQLGGLLRVQQFTQDDAHIFIREDQIEEEIKKVILLIDKMYAPFGLEYRAFLSTRPDDFMGEAEIWKKAETDLNKILADIYGENYGLKEKDGAFYGPKIDFQLKDAIGRTWQCATVQLDFQMPMKFNCRYTDKDGAEKFPVLIHRTILGSFERFMGILIEHYAGAFPLWLSPIQIALVPVSEKFSDYAQRTKEALLKNDFRVTINNDSESLGKRIRAAEKEKIPYILVLGEKEMTAGTVAIRRHGQGDQGSLKLNEFVEKIRQEIEAKKN